jgi:hypothetical protein
VGVAEPLDHADVDDAGVQAAVLTLPGEVGVLQHRHDDLVEGGVAVHLAPLVALFPERHGDEHPPHVGRANARVDVDHGQVMQAGDGYEVIGDARLGIGGVRPYGQGKHAVVSGHLPRVLDQQPVPRPKAGVVRRLVVRVDPASLAVLYQ